MSFYYLSKEMGLALNDILGRVFSYNKDFSREDISITWINYKSENKSVFKGFGTGINNKKMVYPASIVKLVYGLAAFCWIKKGSLLLSDEIIDAVRKMLSFSSNNATSFLIDLLTGTTSGYVACKEISELKEVYLIGHDFFSIDKQFNNIYRGQKFYENDTHISDYNINKWIYEWRRLFKWYNWIKFYKVNRENYLNLRLNAWDDCKNVEYISYERMETQTRSIP